MGRRINMKRKEGKETRPKNDFKEKRQMERNEDELKEMQAGVTIKQRNKEKTHT